MKLTEQQYGGLVKSYSPNSKLWRNLWNAFWTGGLICTAGQLIHSGWALCLDGQGAATATSITLVFLGAFLTGLGVYDRAAKVAGAGTLVPITGFANSIVSPAMEFKAESLVSGTCAKMFTIAGPVLVYGIGSSVLYGLILYCIRLF